jgi:hypothetical protein
METDVVAFALSLSLAFLAQVIFMVVLPRLERGGGVYERDAVIGARGLGMKWEFGGLNPCCWLYLAVVDPLIDPDSEHVVPVSIFNPSLRVPLSSLFSHCLAPPVSLL